MKKIAILALGAAGVAVTAALAQSVTPAAAPTATATVTTPDGAFQSDPNAAVAPPPPPAVVGPPKNAVLELKALNKITGKAIVLAAPLNKPVKFATLTITARTCYSTPVSETPETSAFLQIDDDPPDRSHTRAFSGWMYASSPGLNALQHPLYDVWVISCQSNDPGHAPVAAAAPVKAVSPNAGANEAMPTLPEDAGH